MKTTITVTELSKFIGLSPRQIQIYVSQGVLPKVQKGRYSLEDCVSAYMRHKLLGPGSLASKQAPVAIEFALEQIACLQQRIEELEAIILSRKSKPPRQPQPPSAAAPN